MFYPHDPWPRPKSWLEVLIELVLRRKSLIALYLERNLFAVYPLILCPGMWGFFLLGRRKGNNIQL